MNSPAAPSAKLQSILEQREKAGWQAFKDKNKSALADVTVDEHTTVLADGQGEQDRQATLGAMSQITIHRYFLTDFKLTPLGANAALLRYNASTTYSLGDGQGEDHKLAVGDIWVKRGETMEVDPLPGNRGKVDFDCLVGVGRPESPIDVL